MVMMPVCKMLKNLIKRQEGTYNHHQPAMLGTDMWKEDDASINEVGNVAEEGAKEDEVAQQPKSTTADL